MKNKHARLLFAISILLLTLVTLDFVKLGSKTTTDQSKTSKPKVNLTEKVDEIGKVLSGGVFFYKFKLKESSSDTYITDATATVVNQDAFTGSNACTLGDGITLSNSFFFVSSHYELDCGTNASMTVSVSKSGYQTKQFFLSDYQGTIVEITIEKNAVTPPPAPPASTSKKTKTTITLTETIKDVSLPLQFKGVGTSTTDLTKISDPAKVENLTLDSEANKIIFEVSVDLSSIDTKDKFKTLDTYVKVDKVGTISIDSANLPALNKPATLTMKALKFVKTPRVLVNGKEDSSVAKIISYKNGILIFSVSHFSTFTVAPIIGINEPINNFETNKKTVTLKGSVSDPTASVSAKLNKKNLGKLKVATNGAFQKDIDLEEGLNKIVVSALGANLATASASVSGTLNKSANHTLMFVLIGILFIIGVSGALYSIKKMKSAKTQNSPPKN